MFGDGWCESLVEAARAGVFIFRPVDSSLDLRRLVSDGLLSHPEEHAPRQS
jgi:hypothetical protein